MSECASFLSGAPAVVAGIFGDGPAWFSICREMPLYPTISRYIPLGIDWPPASRNYMRGASAWT